MPQEPARDAEQLATVPPPEPLQVQLHCPAPPDTLLAVPVAQRSVVGAVVNPWPCAAPQEPLEPAEQLALALLPAQVHVHGPLPETPLAVPVAQRSVVVASSMDGGALARMHCATAVVRWSET